MQRQIQEFVQYIQEEVLSPPSAAAIVKGRDCASEETMVAPMVHHRRSDSSVSPFLFFSPLSF